MTSLSPGDVVVDREQRDPDEAVVVNTPPIETRDWQVQSRGCTVADDNPDYPADERVAAVVYREVLEERRPNFCGYQHLKISSLDADGVPFYTFPRSRLRQVGSLDPTTIPVDAISPAPYHSRNFEFERNREFIEHTRARGHPKPIPVIRAVDDGFEVVNGHKRLWVSHIAGLDEIRAHVVHIDDWTAARRFVEHHLEGQYPQREAEVAIERLRERWGDRVAELDIARQYFEPATVDQEEPSRA